MYRVTPIFDGDNLVASGVLMEGYSVEDSGSGISYCVYCYNVQPGININYADGSSSLQEGYSNSSSSSSSSVGNSSYSSSSNSYTGSSSGSTTSSDAASSTASQQQTQSSVPQSADYILNENTKKFHYPSCHSVRQMKNPVAYNGSRDSLLSQGYEPCKNCNPWCCKEIASPHIILECLMEYFDRNSSLIEKELFSYRKGIDIIAISRNSLDDTKSSICNRVV